MEKHKNDFVSTFDTNISVMCKDILDYLEQEPNRDMEEIPKIMKCPYQIRTVEGCRRAENKVTKEN